MTLFSISNNLVAIILTLIAQGGTDKPFYQSEAYRDFRLAGYAVVQEKRFDINGDGRLDTVVLEKSKDGMSLSAWVADERGRYACVFRTAAKTASEVAAFGLISLGTAHKAWLVDVFEDSPDEEDHWVKLLLMEKDALREIFSTEYQKIHSEKDAGRTPVGLVDLGNKALGLSIEPNHEGWPHLKVYNKMKKISVRNAKGSVFELVIGIQEKIFAPRDQIYRQTEDRYIDYLPAIRSNEISIKSKNIKYVPSKNHNLKDILFDNQPQSGVLVDTEKDALVFELRFELPEKIRMLRLVPACMGEPGRIQPCKQRFDFDIQFDGNATLKVRRKSRLWLDERILAVEDFALSGFQHGVQTLVFFKQPMRAQTVRLQIRKALHALPNRSEKLFISEISLHTSLGGNVHLHENDADGS